ncbi:MAG TPA: FmdB family zinc ribbon protein [Pyrinomonadaceae bacterium]|nr:FmdB family zinc ribbon protein [Pyrinomonadaceae bacterium]
MPIYEYECKKCGARTEVMQKMADKPLSKCPKCKGRLEKLLSAAAIQFKGAGWYVTDYAAKKGESKEEKSASEEKQNASPDSSTSASPAASKEGAKEGGKKSSTTATGD